MYACKACPIYESPHIFQNTTVRAYTEIEGGKARQHKDPQTLNGVGVKGLVGERRRNSLL